MEQIVLGEVIDLSGYLLSDVKNYTKDLAEKAKEGDSITYTHNGNSVTIENEKDKIKENVYLSGELPELKEYPNPNISKNRAKRFRTTNHDNAND